MSDNAAYFYKKINEDLRSGGTDVRAEDIIDIMGKVLACQLDMN